MERRSHRDFRLFSDLCGGLRRRKHYHLSAARPHDVRLLNDHCRHERDVFLGEAVATAASSSAHSDREVPLVTRISHQLPYHAIPSPLHFSLDFY